MSAILDFITDNIALIVGLLIIIFSVHSSRKKKRKAAAEAEAGPSAAPPARSFKQILTEIETELEEKPWVNEDNEEPPKGKRVHPYLESAPFGKKGAAYNHPYAEPSDIPQETVVSTLRPSEAAMVEEAKTAVEKQLQVIKKKRKNPFSDVDLVTAVVMSEVLGKPKALRRDENAVDCRSSLDL